MFQYTVESIFKMWLDKIFSVLVTWREKHTRHSKMMENIVQKIHVFQRKKSIVTSGVENEI